MRLARFLLLAVPLAERLQLELAAGRLHLAAEHVTTVAGNGAVGVALDGARAIDSPLNPGRFVVLPGGIGAAPDGRLVIVDVGANQIRILPAGTF